MFHVRGTLDLAVRLMKRLLISWKVYRMHFYELFIFIFIF
jgi:hypothetical protein